MRNDRRPRWRRLDRTDVQFAYEPVYVFVGLETPPVDRLREALTRLTETSPEVFRMMDMASGRWRPFVTSELQEASERIVATSSAATPEDLLAELRGLPAGGPNFRIMVASSGLGIRGNHAGLFDGTSVQLLLRRLLLPESIGDGLRVVPGWQRNAMLADHLVRHPRSIGAALDYKRRQPVVDVLLPDMEEEPVWLSVANGEAPAMLRALRDEQWPGTSVAAVTLAVIRAAFIAVGLTLHPGVEVLYDARRYFPSDVPLIGNWAVGLQLRSEDETSPLAVGQAMRETIEDALPVAAMASVRIPRPGIGGEVSNRPVPGPVGQPRLTFTHLVMPSGPQGLPWRQDGPCVSLMASRPTNAEGILLATSTTDRWLTINTCHYASVWSVDAVREAISAAISDPRGLLSAVRADPGQEVDR